MKPPWASFSELSCRLLLWQRQPLKVELGRGMVRPSCLGLRAVCRRGSAWLTLAHISDLHTELRRRVRHGVEQLLLSLLLLQEAGLNLENQKDHKVLKIFYQSTLDILRSENGL